MGRWVKAKRGRDRSRKESRLAQATLVILLLNGFIWAGLRGLDILVLSLVSMLMALTGLLAALAARRAIRRRRGGMEGDSLATIGYWGNLTVFLLTLLLFVYSLAMGILRGELL